MALDKGDFLHHVIEKKYAPIISFNLSLDNVQNSFRNARIQCQTVTSIRRSSCLSLSVLYGVALAFPLGCR